MAADTSRHTTVTTSATAGRVAWMARATAVVLFVIWAFYMLAVRNADYLYTVSEHSMFLTDSSFFSSVMVRPGGLLTWVALLCCQFFHYPAAGAALLIAVWIAAYAVGIKAFGLRSGWQPLALLPLGALLCSVVVVGYWLFYLKSAGYWFAPSIGLLTTLAAVWLFRRLDGTNHKISLAWMLLWCIVGYFACGWWGLLATLLMAIMGRNRGIGFAVSATGIVAVPIIAYQVYTQMRIEDAWTVGFPVFQLDKYISWLPMLPMLLVVILCVAMSIISRYAVAKLNATKPLHAIITAVITLAVIIVGSLVSDFDDSNFHTELRMYRAADEGRWSDVLQESLESPTHPTREIVMLRNVALTYQGDIGNKMFKYDNLSIPPHTYDSLAVRMAQTNAPLVYMYYARVNFATRWCIENGVEMGFTPDAYKILTRCALIAGETDLASKYINILKHTLFHHEWAEKYEPMLADTTLISQSEEFKNQREYYNHFRSMLDGDEGLVEMYLLQYFSQTMNKDSRLLQETTLVFALQSKDIQLFWPRFFLYAHLHQNEPMPIHYQEAAYLYGNLEHEVDISGMPFDDVKIRQRYASFNSMSQNLISQRKSIEEVGEIMKSIYGDTFWWFYFFCRGMNSY